MGVDLNIYRIRIGLFGSPKINFRINSSPSKKSMNVLLSLTIAFLLLMSDSLNVQNSAAFNDIIPTSQCSNASMINVSVKEVSGNIPLSFTFRWCYCSSTNAICHAIFGNRRRLSYKFAIWNCRKGLLGRQALETPKFIELKPFFSK